MGKLASVAQADLAASPRVCRPFRPGKWRSIRRCQQRIAVHASEENSKDVTEGKESLFYEKLKSIGWEYPSQQGQQEYERPQGNVKTTTEILEAQSTRDAEWQAKVDDDSLAGLIPRVYELLKLGVGFGIVFGIPAIVAFFFFFLYFNGPDIWDSITGQDSSLSEVYNEEEYRKQLDQLPDEQTEERVGFGKKIIRDEDGRYNPYQVLYPDLFDELMERKKEAANPDVVTEGFRKAKGMEPSPESSLSERGLESSSFGTEP